jgi:hypothetical protein
MGPDISYKSYADLNRTILEVVVCDFEPFESIVSKISKSSDDEAFDEVRLGLRALLTDGLVGAFLIHAEPPYATPVNPESDNMHWYWYTITAQGKSYLLAQI